MHKSSMDKMYWFVETYLPAFRNQKLTILDLGSMDVNGSYKDLFDAPLWHYQGIDQEAGRNVNIVLADSYNWKEIQTNSQDVIISGQAFEHVEYFWILLEEIGRVLKPGGLVCIIAPSRGYEHRYPVDCWRFYPDAFKALAKYTGLGLLHVQTQWEKQGYTVDDSDDWGDTIAVFRKPDKWSFRFRLFLMLRRWLNQQSIRITRMHD